MRLFDIDSDVGLELAERVSEKYKPAFDKLPPARRAAVALYFLPHKSQKKTLAVTRPRVVKWYCPFTHQKYFPSGHRYCINVYVGCAHECQYCYARSYEPDEAKRKQNFEKKLLKDLSEIEEFDLPPAPVHISNSSDPLQPIEHKQKLTLYTLRQLLRYRRYFTSIVILTKNPALLLQPQYITLLQQLQKLTENHPRKAFFEANSIPPLRVEVSLAFFEQPAAHFYESGAPTVSTRTEAVRQLRREGIPVVLRIDPLLPRSPLPAGKTLADFQLPDAQSLSSLENLVRLASENNVMHIVYSSAKIVVPRFKPIHESMQRLKQVYEYISKPDKLLFRGGSWRLPDHITQEQIVEPFLQICNSYDIKAYFCKQNLLSTP